MRLKNDKENDSSGLIKGAFPRFLGLSLGVLLAHQAFASGFVVKGRPRSNSQACINRFQDLHKIATEYLKSAPSSSAVERFDKLEGGIRSTSAFTGLALGKQYTTEYFSVESGYLSADGKYRGSQSISSGVSSDLDLSLSNGVNLSLDFGHSSCDLTEKAYVLNLNFQNTLPLSVAGVGSTCDMTRFSALELCDSLNEKSESLNSILSDRRTKVAEERLEINYKYTEAVTGVEKQETILPSDVDTESKLNTVKARVLSRLPYGSLFFNDPWQSCFSSSTSMFTGDSNERALRTLALAAKRKELILDFIDRVKSQVSGQTLEKLCSRVAR